MNKRRNHSPFASYRPSQVKLEDVICHNSQQNRNLNESYTKTGVLPETPRKHRENLQTPQAEAKLQNLILGSSQNVSDCYISFLEKTKLFSYSNRSGPVCAALWLFLNNWAVINITTEETKCLLHSEWRSKKGTTTHFVLPEARVKDLCPKGLNKSNLHLVTSNSV